MWELPFPVYHFSLPELHVIVFLSKESHVRAVTTATGINFDKKTWRYRDNSRGIRWREEERTESPKTNGIVRHTAAGYDREKSTLSNANVTERHSEDNRGARATEIYCCLPQFIFTQNTRVFRRNGAVPSETRLIRGEIYIAILAAAFIIILIIYRLLFTCAFCISDLKLLSNFRYIFNFAWITWMSTNNTLLVIKFFRANSIVENYSCRCTVIVSNCCINIITGYLLGIVSHRGIPHLCLISHVKNIITGKSCFNVPICGVILLQILRSQEINNYCDSHKY